MGACLVMLWEGAQVRETPLLGTVLHIPQNWTSYGFGRSLQLRNLALSVCWTSLLEKNSRRAFNNWKLFGSGFYFCGESISTLNN